MWRFLRRQRAALLSSVALHLVFAALLLISAYFTPPKSKPDARLHTVKARLVEIPQPPFC
ncbi:cell envelope integrity protein TolA [Chromatium okenii]|uniref:Uncharacterized protein n=1 Tax=Chromatium okenii TaxID=61644 RepID=A0A2S7XVR4_9GAMM|nr:cell envelope integrity protein TolA [Chromatium okenii]PQJ97512.1 hypothetical protein CXB77_01145 [Chromatium okenii]